MSSGVGGLIELLLLAVFLFFFLRWFVGVGIGAPFLPARRRDVADAFAIANVTAADVVIDLGSGDGRFLGIAAKKGARVIGYELNPFLVWWSRFQLRTYQQVQIYRKNLFEADLKGVTVIFIFQMTHVMPRLAEKIHKEAPRARIISVAFDIPGYETKTRRGVVKELIPVDKNTKII